MTRKKQRITLEDVAREAGVSSMTVSRVINRTGRISQATRDHVSAVIARLDYRPSRAARALVTNKTFMIGLVVQDITNPYFSEVVQGVEAFAWERDYSVLLANTNETPAREEAILSQIDDSTIDGLIVCSSRLPDHVLIPLLERHRAVVVINRALPEHVGSVIRHVEGYDGRALKALTHMIEVGYHSIGYLCLKHSAAQVTLEKYLTLLTSRGIAADPDWYRLCAPTWQSGYDGGRALLTAHPELDSIVGGNDLVALGAMRAALEMGLRVPDDLAVVGGDDSLIASLVTPALTTFRMPKYEIGLKAGELLFQRMAGDAQFREYLVTDELIVRDSSP